MNIFFLSLEKNNNKNVHLIKKNISKKINGCKICS